MNVQPMVVPSNVCIQSGPMRSTAARDSACSSTCARSSTQGAHTWEGAWSGAACARAKLSMTQRQAERHALSLSLSLSLSLALSLSPLSVWRAHTHAQADEIGGRGKRRERGTGLRSAYCPCASHRSSKNEWLLGSPHAQHTSALGQSLQLARTRSLCIRMACTGTTHRQHAPAAHTGSTHQ